VLELQKIKLLEKYKNYVLKLEPFLLSLSGYNPQETRLKIDTFYLHCTPATFSMTKCSLLLYLGEKEGALFSKYTNKLISLNMAFDETYFGRPVSFYLKGKLDNIKKIRDNVYSLDFTLTTISETYKELFLFLSEIASIHKKLYMNKLNQSQIDGLHRVPIRRTEVSSEGKFIGFAMINNLSTRHLELQLEQGRLESNNRYKYSITFNNRELKLSGKIVKTLENQYISSLDFNLEYVHILSRYMNMYNSPSTSGHDTEELEEL